MSSRLVEFVDPWRLAGTGKVISGTVKLAVLPRLADVLHSTNGDVQYQLEFYSGEKKRPKIKGFVRAELILTCQRCLGPVVLPVDSMLNLAVIEVPEEAELLSEECDPVWVEDGQIQLLDLVEEELLLAVPQVARHSLGGCSEALMEEYVTQEEFQPEAADKVDSVLDEENPFAVLAGLKKDH